MVADQKSFDEAILLPQARLRVSDPEILYGTVEMVPVVTDVWRYERPWGVSGGFATVYKFRTQTGMVKALRCFRVAMGKDSSIRFSRLSEYLRTHLSGITVNFQYYEEGILVKEQVQGVVQKVPHSITVMDWIEGLTLIEKVDELCRKRDQQALRQLIVRWVGLLRILRLSHVAHGDLSGVNVMVRPDGDLVLVDYDGMYIPTLDCQESSLTNGLPDYQHPQMELRPFDERMDDFSGYVIYIVLRALLHRPDLWDKYTPHGPNGELLDSNMLFKRSDFADPERSPLFADLEAIGDPLLSHVLRSFKAACQQPIGQLCLPALDEELERQFLPPLQWQQECCLLYALLRRAIQYNMDREIVQIALELDERIQEPFTEKVVRDAVDKAKRCFIGQIHVGDVLIEAKPGGDIRVNWRWPSDPLVQFAVVAWSDDRSNLDKRGGYLYHPIRRGCGEQGSFCFNVGRRSRVFLQVLCACPDRTIKGVTWLYSRGDTTPCEVTIR